VDASSLSFAQDGRMFVAGCFEHRIQVFDAQGGFLRNIYIEGLRRAAMLPTGNLVVTRLAEQHKNCLVVMTDQGKFVQTMGRRGTGPGEFQGPDTVIVNQKGYILCEDAQDSRIKVFKPDGEFVFDFGGQGTEPGKFDSILGISFTPSNQIVVSDCVNMRIQIFSEQGEYERSISVSDLPGLHTHPGAIMCDRDGNIVICVNPGSVKIVNAEGDPITTLWGELDGEDPNLLPLEGFSAGINPNGHLVMFGRIPLDFVQTFLEDLEDVSENESGQIMCLPGTEDYDEEVDGVAAFLVFAPLGNRASYAQARVMPGLACYDSGALMRTAGVI
jgi:hypothetical protein